MNIIHNSLDVFATTAQLPGLSYVLALEKIHQGVSEGLWGDLKSDHVQICPQTAGVVSEDVAYSLVEKYPQTKLRLHANARVLKTHVRFDASTYSPDTHHYYDELFKRQAVFQSSWMSIHSGYKKNCSTKQWFDNVKKLQDLAQTHQTNVCIEGLYPLKQNPQFIDSYKEYEWLLQNDIPLALDLSHINIVAKKEGWNFGLIQDLLSSPLCQEIHVSDNDGLRDSHAQVTTPPKWLSLLEFKNDHSLVFSEGGLLSNRKFSYS